MGTNTRRHTARFTESALAAELDRLKNAETPASGLTFEEIKEGLGRGDRQIRRDLQLGVKAGTIEVTKGKRSNVVGGLSTAYYYRAVKKKKRS